MEKTRRRESPPLTWITGIGKAQFVFLAAGALLLLLFTWIAFGLDDPDGVTLPLSTTALCLSSLAGGIAAVRCTGDGILSGLVSGTVSLLLVRALALLPLPSAAPEPTRMFLHLCLIPALSICGAVLGKKRKKQTKHRHR